eukprot:1134456-Rhodomonas_salina.2
MGEMTWGRTSDRETERDRDRAREHTQLKTASQSDMPAFPGTHAKKTRRELGQGGYRSVSPGRERCSLASGDMHRG